MTMNNKRILYIIISIILYTCITLVNPGNILVFDNMLGVFNATGRFSFILVLVPLAIILLVVSLVLCLVFRAKCKPMRKSLCLTVLLIVGIVLTEILSLLYGTNSISVWFYVVSNVTTFVVIVLFVLQRYLYKVENVNK